MAAGLFFGTMRLPFTCLFALSLAVSGFSADFAARFSALTAAATPAQLYALLYDLPKGGDLHNHSGGSDRPEWLFAICTDPARNGGDTFYTRARFPGEPDAIAPAQRFHNLRHHAYERLSAGARREYVALSDLTPAERQAWCDSLRLDQPGEGRDEFFRVIWPRRGQIDSASPWPPRHWWKT